MPLPAPNLDDRTFQELVDEAKRYVQRACPTWTNHNVSDPGVTLIETFAWMTDLLLYRLNRVPERNYVRFLDLLGVTPFPPAAARTDITFRLSTAEESAVRIPSGTVVSTRRTVQDASISFTTIADLVVPPARTVQVSSLLAEDPDRSLRDHTAAMGVAGAFTPFADRPRPDDALYLGLSEPAPASLMLLQFRCEVGGHGIDPSRPPLVWEAWDGTGWERCEVERDTTLGLNTSGSVELVLPRAHGVVSVAGQARPWLRCRVVERVGVRGYRSSPRILSVVGATVGGYVPGVHAERVDNERLGESDGVAGQLVSLRRTPLVLTVEPLVLEVGHPRHAPPSGVAGALLPAEFSDRSGSGTNGSGTTSSGTTGSGTTSSDTTGDDLGKTSWRRWRQVPNFADSGPEDHHFTVDATTGALTFGPAVREPNGRVRRYGAVPPKGSVLRIASYFAGGGRAGNVNARSLTVLRSSIPFVAAVYNRRAASGGVDGETLAEAKVRGPLAVRTRNRAVTAADFEQLAREIAPGMARVRCVRDGDGLRLLVVPSVTAPDGRVGLADLIPDTATGERIRDYLDERRLAGVRLVVEPPSYVGITVVARVRAAAGHDPERVKQWALRALYDHFNPVVGGPQGTGWPFSRPVQVGEAFGVLQRVEGIDYVEEALLFAANPLNGDRVGPEDRIDLDPTNLVLSYEHEVHVEVGSSEAGR